MTTPATQPAPVCTPVRRGFTLACIKCGEDACLQLDLADLQTITCPECNGEYTVADVQTIIGEWAKLIAWIGMAPEMPAE